MFNKLSKLVRKKNKAKGNLTDKKYKSLVKKLAKIYSKNEISEDRQEEVNKIRSEFEKEMGKLVNEQRIKLNAFNQMIKDESLIFEIIYIQKEIDALS